MLYFILYKYLNGAVRAVYEENIRTAPPEYGVCLTISAGLTRVEDNHGTF